MIQLPLDFFHPFESGTGCMDNSSYCTPDQGHQLVSDAHKVLLSVLKLSQLLALLIDLYIPLSRQLAVVLPAVRGLIPTEL